MRFEPLQTGVLLRRYKRFFADIETPDGTLTVHCPNTGAMTGCADVGSAVLFTRPSNSSAKLAGTLQWVHTRFGWACVNTHIANRLVAEALERGDIAELPLPRGVLREPRRDHHRFDFAIEWAAGTVLLEVKSVTWCIGDGVGRFPDAISARAQSQLALMRQLLRQGQRCVLVYLALNEAIQCIESAGDVDPRYAAELAAARADGLQVLSYGIRFAPPNVEFGERLVLR